MIAPEGYNNGFHGFAKYQKWASKWFAKYAFYPQ